MRLSRGLGISILCGALLTGTAHAQEDPKRWDGRYFPNTPLVTQEGKRVRFYDDLVKGKVVAINFFFTHCKDMCPAETANLLRVEKLLGDRVGKDVFFYSISIDPKWDTPQALKEYASKFGAGPKWTFLTGKKADVTHLRKKLGLYRKGNQQEQLNQHSVSLIIGNEARGKWIKRSAFDHPKILARLLGSDLQNYPMRSDSGLGYVSAPSLSKFSRGDDLFRSRCISCHSLGSEEGIGPGLAGIIQRRDPLWLKRWLKAPDQMIDDKDPIALELLKKYNGVRMPNFKLTEVETDALISYMGGGAREIKPSWLYQRTPQ